jgi:hypothetical protein
MINVFRKRLSSITSLVIILKNKLASICDMVVENCVRIAENKPKKTTSKLKYMSKCDDFFFKKKGSL